MADQLTQEQVQAAAEEAKIKSYLKDKYGIEDDPDTFRTKQARIREQAELAPRYHATLEALVQAAEEAEKNAPKRAVEKGATEDDEDNLRVVFQADPYEGTRRVLKGRDAAIEERIEAAKEEAAQEAERRITARDLARQAFQQVQRDWPEAFDRNSELHKLGKQIFQTEMTQAEQRNPRAFLIATERAAGRRGLAPKGLREAAVDPREDAGEQNVSRQGRRVRGDGEQSDKLNAKQERIANIMDLDKKAYARIARARKEGRNLDE